MPRKAIGIVGVLGLSGALAACASTGEISGDATAFDRELHAGYAEMSQREFDETDLVDGRAFARRAQMAGAGAPPDPEPLAMRKLVEPHRSELADARDRLTKALGGGGKEKAPSDSARAQLGFDCWMQEAEENFQPDDIAGCKSQFMTAMSTLVAKLEPMERQTAETSTERLPEPQTAAPAQAAPMQYAVFFAFDKASITPKARTVIDSLAQQLKQAGQVKVELAGHADRAGPTTYNQQLSQKRVEAVVSELKKNGIDAAIEAKAFGESQPIVATGDGVPEPRNRRVEIKLDR